MTNGLTEVRATLDWADVLMLSDLRHSTNEIYGYLVEPEAGPEESGDQLRVYNY